MPDFNTLLLKVSFPNIGNEDILPHYFLILSMSLEIIHFSC